MGWSTSRVIFVIVFFIVFAVAMFFTYKKDIKKNPKLFKGAWKLLLLVILVVVVYFITTRYLLEHT